MRINTNTGRLIWVPRMADGGTTNAGHGAGRRTISDYTARKR